MGPPKIVFGLESTNMHFFQNAFFLDYSSVLQSFYGNTFFFKPKWRLVSRWRFCHFKITLFSKNSPNNDKYKNKNFNGFTKDIYSKKLINWSSSTKIQYGPENQDGCKFRVFVKILLLQHGLCLNL
jgi:hypothetical protein